MLAPVELYDQFALKTGEIGDIAPNRCLTTEFHAADLAAPETIPKAFLNLGLAFAKLAGKKTRNVVRISWISRAAPHPPVADRNGPLPLPQRGEGAI